MFSRSLGGKEMPICCLAAHYWLITKGIQRVDAKVASQNAAAIRFYKRIGYVVIGQDGVIKEGSPIPVYAISINLTNKTHTPNLASLSG